MTFGGRADEEPEVQPAGFGNVLAVATVTIANGGDNIGITTSTMLEIGVFVAAFAIMAAVWLWLAHSLVKHPSLGAPVIRYGHLLVPFVLIAIGFLILREAGSFTLLGS